MSSKETASLPARHGTFTTFKVARESKLGTARKRLKYGKVRRQEVKDVRKRGACLRCRLLQIKVSSVQNDCLSQITDLFMKCSSGDPCTTCMKLASASTATVAFEKKILHFSDCIRTLPSQVSVFQHGKPILVIPNLYQALILNLIAIPPPELRNIINQKTNGLASAPLSLEYAAQIKWDLPSLCCDMVDWLNNPQLSTISKVGTLSAPQFLDLVTPHLEKNVISDFQRMLYTESLSYIEPVAPEKRHLRLKVNELQQIGALSGHNCLGYLDRRLKPQSLALCSLDDLRALFLLLVGTSLAVGYAKPTMEHPPFPLYEVIISNYENETRID